MNTARAIEENGINKTPSRIGMQAGFSMDGNTIRETAGRKNGRMETNGDGTPGKKKVACKNTSAGNEGTARIARTVQRRQGKKIEVKPDEWKVRI